MCGGHYGGGSHCGGCNCLPELTIERLERKEKWLEESLEWVKEKKEELAKTDK